MNKPPEQQGLGKRIAEQAAMPVVAYDAYVWMVHTHDHPEDFVAMQERLEVDHPLATQRAEAWASADRKQTAQTLYSQLNLVLRLTLDATDMTRDYNEAVQTGYNTVVGSYLVGIVGPLAMQGIKTEDWFQKNQPIQNLRNPFESSQVLQFCWERQANRSTAILGRVTLPPYELVAPGYFTAPSA